MGCIQRAAKKLQSMDQQKLNNGENFTWKFIPLTFLDIKNAFNNVRTQLECGNQNHTDIPTF